MHRVELTDAGEAAFERMRQTVAAFDRRLRKGLSDEQVEQLAALLTQLRDNAIGIGGPPP